MNGRGIMYDEAGNKKYDGNYKDGKEDGTGILFDFKSGTHYEGEFKNGHMDGQGVYSQVDQDGTKFSFTGEFKDGSLFNGNMITTLADGFQSSTEYKNGIKGKTKKLK
jgi:hypothetical protein